MSFPAEAHQLAQAGLVHIRVGQRPPCHLDLAGYQINREDPQLEPPGQLDLRLDELADKQRDGDRQRAPDHDCRRAGFRGAQSQLGHPRLLRRLS